MLLGYAHWLMLRCLILPLCLLMHPLAAVDVYLGTMSKTAEGIFRANFDPEQGKLTRVELAAQMERPAFLAFHPQRHTLYAIARPNKEASVVAYRIWDDGALELLNVVPTGDDNAAHIAVHPSGKFLLTAQYRAGSVALFPLQADGSLGERQQLIRHEGGSGVVPQRQSAPHPHWVGFSPDGRFAFVPDLGLDQIVIYAVNLDTLELEPAGYVDALPGAGPRHMRFSADGRYVYLLNELTLAVTSFAYNSENGALEPRSTTQALTDELKAKERFNSSSEILVHPNGRFVYSANRGHDSVTAYTANLETGALAVIEVEPIRGAWPRNIAMDSTGAWLLAAGMHSNTVSVFAIDADSGELSFPRGHVVSAPAVSCILLND